VALKVIEDAKDRLQVQKEKRKLLNQNEIQTNGAMNMTCPPTLPGNLLNPECKDNPAFDSSTEMMQAHANQENAKQLEAWQKDNENLRNQNELLQNELNEIKAKMKKENELNTEKISTAMNQNELLKNENTDLIAEKDDLKKKLEISESNLKNVNKALDDLKNENTTLYTLRDKTVPELNDELKRVKKERNKKSDLNAKYEQLLAIMQTLSSTSIQEIDLTQYQGNVKTDV